MTLGIVVFGAAFLVGLGLGTYTRRPLSTAFLVLGSFTALLVASATGEVLSAAAILVIVALVGLVAESMRETFALLVGRYCCGREDSNLQEPCGPTGPKPAASASSATPAQTQCRGEACLALIAPDEERKGLAHALRHQPDERDDDENRGRAEHLSRG